MKIGLVSPYDFASPGGVSDHVRHLSKWLRHMGHDVRIFAPSSNKDAEREIEDFYRIGRVFPIPVNESVARITLSFHLADRVAEILERERFDVLHFHEPLMPALPLHMLRISQTANVGTFHAFAKSNVGYYYGRPLLKRYLSHLHRRIAVSAAARDFVRQYFDVDLRVIPNGVEADTFGPDLAPIRHLRDGRINVLFLGRLEKRKGLNQLLRGFAYMRERIPKVRLIIVGDGPMRSDVEQQISRLRLGPDVVMAGYVPDEIKPRYYATADIFCAPATGGESFGIVLLEAMASALPVVCTEVPGYLGVVEPGVDALTARPKSWAELGIALTVLGRDRELRARLAANGLLKARTYSWREITSQILEVYQEARQVASGLRDQGIVHDAIPEVG